MRVVLRGAGTISYVGGPTDENKVCGKSGGGAIHRRSPYILKWRGHIPFVPPVAAPLVVPRGRSERSHRAYLLSSYVVVANVAHVITVDSSSRDLTHTSLLTQECISWAYHCDAVNDCGCTGVGCDEFGCLGFNWC